MSSEVKESSSDVAKRKYDLIYGLDDKPAPPQAIYGALQHLLAMFVGIIITAAIIISGVLGLSVEYSSFLISMALFASGVGTFIQVSRFGPLGSGLGVHFVPEVFSNMPQIIKDIGHSSIAVGGMSAILATIVLNFGGQQKEEINE